ncbi:MAG: hypothetical protein LBD76_04120 [Prevotellaceae bacterium]|nr:hypothetical protein [Prevotellaceae bacterium]
MLFCNVLYSIFISNITVRIRNPSSDKRRIRKNHVCFIVVLVDFDIDKPLPYFDER